MKRLTAGMFIAIALALASLTIAAQPQCAACHVKSVPGAVATGSHLQFARSEDMSNTRQTIFDAVKAGFATLTTANGYTSNVGQKVNEWETTAIDAANDASLLPCVCLSDPREVNLGPGNDSSENSAHRIFAIEFEASLLLAEANQTAAKARQAEADVKTMIGKDQTWGGLAKRTEPEDGVLMLDKEGGRVSGVHMKFTVKYGRETWAG